MNSVAAAPVDRLGTFVRTQLWPNPWRIRAFLRIEVGLLLALFIMVTFKPKNAYWIAVYILLVTLPIVGNSVLNAVYRFYASVVGCAVAFLVIIAAYDAPWVYAPLQAAITGLTLFITRSTPIGPVAMTGGATFVIITGSDVGQPPANLITLGFYRILLSVIGGGIGALAQLTFWSDDPLEELKSSLAKQIAEVEARLSGKSVALDVGRMSRHFELLANAQMRHRGLVGRRSEIAEVILEVARLVDQTVRQQILPSASGSPRALLDQADKALRRVQSAELYEPPPPTPSAPPLSLRRALRGTMAPGRRAALKTALSAFIAIVVTLALGYPPSGALFVGVALALELTSGTTISKPLLTIGGVLLGLAVMMVVITPWMPNLEGPGSLLILAAVAFAPTVWLMNGGPRVRNAGFFGTVVVIIALLQDFRPAVGLEEPARFAFGLGMGALVFGAVDCVLWPVDARRGMLQHAAFILRDTAALYRESDPRVVLAANQQSRWGHHRHLIALVQSRSERLPLPGTPEFEPEEEALRIAVDTQRLVVARVDEARRELAAGAPAQSAKEKRERIAAELDAQAEGIERRIR